MLSEGSGWPVAPPRAEQHSGSTLRSCLPPPRPAGRGVHPRTIHLWVVGESGLMDVCFAGHRMRAFKMCNSVALGIYELCGHVHHQFWSTFTPRKETLHPFRCPSLPQNYFSGAAVTNDHTLSGLRQ